MATEIASLSAVASPMVKQPSLETVIENRIFVGGIPAQANEAELRAFLTERFSKAEIKDIKIISDRAGVSKGYGFVTFETRDMAQAVLNSPEYENMIFKDRKLNISKAVKKLSTRSASAVGDHGAAAAAVAAAAAASIPIQLDASGNFQYLLYSRPNQFALPFGYCTPIYLNAAAAAQQMPLHCPALQWPPLPPAPVSSEAATAAAAQLQVVYYSLPTTAAASGYGGGFGGLSFSSGLAGSSFPTAVVSSSSGGATLGGFGSDYGTCSEPSSSSLTDPERQDESDIGGAILSPTTASAIGMPIKSAFGDNAVAAACCCRCRCYGDIGGSVGVGPIQQVMKPLQHLQSAAADCCDLFLGGGIGHFGDVRQEFKFLDH